VSPYVVLHVFGSDISAVKAWELIDWCRLKGADEFTLHAIIAQGASEATLAPFDEAAAPYQLPAASRRHLTAPLGSDLVTATKLWSLTPGTTTALRQAFPQGPFDYFPSDAWFEDLEIYREHELMLGIVTHEHEGVLRVTPEERAELDHLGFAYRDRGEWVEY